MLYSRPTYIKKMNRAQIHAEIQQHKAALHLTAAQMLDMAVRFGNDMRMLLAELRFMAAKDRAE